MATDATDLRRTFELMNHLSESSRKMVRDLVELLADREDLEEGLDEEERELFSRLEAGDLSGTVTLEEAKQLIFGDDRGQTPCSR